MLVYGDPQVSIRASLLGFDVLDYSRRASGQDLDELRTLLIRAGQLEQAWCDEAESGRHAGLPINLLSRMQAITDAAARAFYFTLDAAAGTPSGARAAEALAQAREGLENLPGLPDRALVVKVPEGFEFYALYPEQYCRAALDWAAAHPVGGNRHVLVIGIRSIGTTLSALVMAVLRDKGYDVVRTTIRPTGPPYKRQAEMDWALAAGRAWALVVDEGPGISGSSMVAAGEAANCAGIEREKIVFFPGHASEPGAAATGEVRDWWSRAERRVVNLEELRWGGATLTDHLARRLVSRGFSPAVTGMEYVSGGRWRRLAYTREEEWPAVATPFERLKYYYRDKDGRGWLWKFAGLGSLRRVPQLIRDDTAVQQWVVPPADTFHGFECFAWVEGRRMRPDDSREPRILRELGNYLAASLGPSETVEEHAAGVHRLAEMLFWNTQKTLGEELAANTIPAVHAAQLARNPPTYTDGRMDPHEWLLTPSGQVRKTDFTGNQVDHTLVGPQAWFWDLAGLVVTWRLGEAEFQELLRVLGGCGLRVDAEVFHFYFLSFLAFRMGRAEMCLQMNLSDPEERGRLEQTSAMLKEKLAAALKPQGSSGAARTGVVGSQREA